MKVLVTGAGGFIGSWVSRKILETRDDSFLYLFDRKAIAAEDWNQDRVQIVTADIRDLDLLDLYLRKVDICIHTALGWGNDPYELVENDVKVTSFILSRASRYGHRKFLYTSSINAIGHRTPFMDEGSRTNPNNLYSSTKAASEALILGWAAVSGLSCGIVRPAYTFGLPATPHSPSQPAQEFPRIAKEITEGSNMEFKRNDGAQLLPVEFLADFFDRLIDIDFKSEIFQVAGTEYVRWKHVAEMMIQKKGSRSKLHEIDGDFPSEPNLFCNKKATAILGYPLDASSHLNTYLDHLLSQHAN